MSGKEKKVFSGKVIDVSVLNVLLPNGASVQLDKVSHPGASLVVAFFKGKIAFLKQYRPVIDKHIWELPAGKLSAGESPETCAKRELIEETGLIADDMVSIGRIHTSPGFTDEVIYIFKAECAEIRPSEMDEDEIIDIHFLEKGQVLELFKKGEITDAKTIAALAFADFFS